MESCTTLPRATRALASTEARCCRVVSHRRSIMVSTEPEPGLARSWATKTSTRRSRCDSDKGRGCSAFRDVRACRGLFAASHSPRGRRPRGGTHASASESETWAPHMLTVSTRASACAAFWHERWGRRRQRPSAWTVSGPGGRGATFFRKADRTSLCSSTYVVGVTEASRCEKRAREEARRGVGAAEGDFGRGGGRRGGGGCGACGVPDTNMVLQTTRHPAD